jgi:hypothetical protein
MCEAPRFDAVSILGYPSHRVEEQHDAVRIVARDGKTGMCVGHASIDADRPCV